MPGRRIDIGHEGFGGYLAVPPAGSGPGLLLLTDGADAGLATRAAEGYAEEGYVVLAPDLSRSLHPASDPASRDSLDEKRGLQQVAVALVYLRTRPECTGKAGVLGFGLGGRLAWLAAAHTDVDAAVGYCPTGIETLLTERAACPTALHLPGTEDGGPHGALAAIREALSEQRNVRLYGYAGCEGRFYDPSGRTSDKAAALMAYSRSIALLREALGPSYDLSALWEEHTFQEFGARDAAATMRSMVAQPYVNHIPTMTGGVGHDDLLRFYRHHFIPKTPADTRLVPISRTVGADRLVDEMLFCFTHDIEIDWMLPGIPPTGRYVEIPLVAIVRFRGDKLYNEHIYWDQASVLVQIGKLDPAGLPVAGIETGRKLLDESLPSNTLMVRWAESQERN